MRMPAAIAALACLAACATTPHAEPAAPAFAGESARYHCSDDRDVDIVYGGDAAVVTIGGQAVQMTQAVSADGARYTGGGWQWWGKGTRDGMLAPLAAGETVASAAGVSCSVR